jgi:DNA polymerase III alpha subunit (gram-positive type)
MHFKHPDSGRPFLKIDILCHTSLTMHKKLEVLTGKRRIQFRLMLSFRIAWFKAHHPDAFDYTVLWNLTS